MHDQDEYFLMKLAREKMKDYMQEAKAYRMIRQARGDQESRIVRLGCRGLACLGGLLIAVGRRLVKIAAAHGGSVAIHQSPGSMNCEYT